METISGNKAPTIETPMTIKKMAKVIGVGQSTISAIKNKLGISRRYIFPSEILGYLKDNPTFRRSDVYPDKPKKKMAGRN